MLFVRGWHKPLCPYGHPRTRGANRWFCRECNKLRSRRRRRAVRYCACGAKIHRVPGRHHTRCLNCRKGRTMPRTCPGYGRHECGKRITLGQRCGPCQIAVQYQRQFDETPSAPGPKVCGLAVRGKVCLEALLFQVNRAGETIVWCPTHGERRMPVIRPGQPGYPNERLREAS